MSIFNARNKERQRIARTPRRFAHKRRARMSARSWSAAVLCRFLGTGTLIVFGALLAAENEPVPLPGKGLAQHDFLYSGEWDTRKTNQTMFLIKSGKVAWTYEIPIK